MDDNEFESVFDNEDGFSSHEFLADLMLDRLKVINETVITFTRVANAEGVADSVVSKANKYLENLLAKSKDSLDQLDSLITKIELSEMADNGDED